MNRWLNWLRRIEARALLLAIAGSGALWTFQEVASAVNEGGTREIDRAILLALRNPADLTDPIGPRTFEEAMRDITALGGFTVVTLATLVGVLAFLFEKRWRHALVLAVTVIAANLSSELTKAFYDRDRPGLVPHGSYVYSASFPSGHSTMAAATFLTLAVLLAGQESSRATKILTIALAALLVLAIGASRVYLGVHWPSDVLAGWCLGSAWALAAWLAIRRFSARTPEAPKPEES